MTRTVLITGCSSGLGEAAAHLFADRGWNVIATMRRPQDGVALEARANVSVVRLDVEDLASIDAAVAEGLARFGRIDALVNNAGYGVLGVFEATSRERIQRQFDVNLFGVMDVTRALLPHFRANRAGVVVNISSGAGVFGLPMLPVYNASKFALEGFSEGLSYELAGLGIRVKLVEPGGMATTNFLARSGREYAEADQIADYGGFLAAAGAIYAGFREGGPGASGEDVARVVYEATTDETDQLRYVATQDIATLVALRREASEAQYMAVMRGQFGWPQ